MNVIKEPTVTVVGAQAFKPHPEYKIPFEERHAISLGAFAAKGCYDSFGEDGRSCAQNQLAILEHAHGSVLEHLVVTVFIEGITRALSLELNRHRHFAISQRSTRYTKEGDGAIVLEPFYADIYDKGTFASETEQDLLHYFLHACETAFETYEEQVETLMEIAPPHIEEGFARRKWARGKARNVLPHALETRGTYTTNMRAWRWFIESRSSRYAEPEIRRLADAVYDTLGATDYGLYLSDFYLRATIDGIPEWSPTYSKV